MDKNVLRLRTNGTLLMGRVVHLKVEADGDIHLAPTDATGDRAGIVAEIPVGTRKNLPGYTVWEIHPIMRLRF